MAEVEHALLREWTEAVGRWVVWREFQERGSGRVPHARIDGCWVDDGPGLVVRFTVSGQRFGLRLDRLDVDLLTGHPIAAGTSSDTASRQALNIYDGTLFGPDDGSPYWSDSSGRVWHGAEPGPGWAAVQPPAPGATVLLLDDELV